MEYGSLLKKPPISESVYPGSWAVLHNKSPFIISAVETVLEHIVKKLGYKIPSDVKLRLFTAGAQIVSGINIYLEFRILSDPTIDVQAKVNEGAVFHHIHSSEDEQHTNEKPRLEITELYVTSKNILK